VSLNSDVNYVVVVQQWCQPHEGAWAVTFSGPGTVDSENLVAVPEFTMGAFSNGHPTVSSECGGSQFIESGPIQVAESGTYYYSDISMAFDVDMCLQIYSAPFNSNNPNADLVGRFDDTGQVELASGQDYYFVVQPLDIATTGEFFYIFAPPAPFRINTYMAGSWFNSETKGQGFLLDVFDNINQLFLAWFTFDLTRPDETASAQLGEPGHRWVTAQGPFRGNTATLTAYLTEGGVFDDAEPAAITDLSGYGTIDLEFNDCKSGTITYDLASPFVTGAIPITRISEDSVPLCEKLTTGPGMPGSL
jgi:hypothetical protein